MALAFVLTGALARAQQPAVYPAHWWTGMKWNKVQLMLHGNQLANAFPMVKMPATGMQLAKGVRLVRIHRTDNPNYLFLDVVIDAGAKPGKIALPFLKGPQALSFELKARRKGNGTSYAQGITSADFIYFLMPDRFSNGNPSNDRVPGLRDQSLNRDSIYHRHGGDFDGIIRHLDYIQRLGATSVWLTPVIENDMPNRTEHGYAFTDHYKVDPRLGGEAGYKQLSDSLHQRGMKLIQDAVYNHVGSYHFTVLDKPMKDWLHEWPSYTQTTYRDQPLMDTHASAYDQKHMSDGWFVPSMPDLNQQNPFVANFLIQHALWSVEEFGIDGWRIDTYIYNDLAFMNRCNKALTDEFPRITMFGETWVHGVSNQAFFVRNNFDIPFKSNLTGATDFQALYYGITPAVNDKPGWTDGVNKLYQTLSQDFLYKEPMNNVVFLDNHDMTRFFSTVNEDTAKLKMGLAWLLTTRGIPQLYYGTEVLMKGISNPDGWVRLDFPGGWGNQDTANAFTGQGLTPAQQHVLQYTTTLANFRRNSPAIQTGKLMQYVPDDGIYVYFRYNDAQTVMCVMNTNDSPKHLSTKRFAESLGQHTTAIDVITKESIILSTEIVVPAKTVLVLSLQ